MSEQAWARDAEKTEKHGDQIKVLSFNILLDGKMGVPGIIDVIRKSDADIVGLQEAGANVPRMAKELGMQYIQNGDAAVLTRLPIDRTTPSKNGIIMHTANGAPFAFFDEHLFYKPYQPYQLLGIPYEGAPNLKTEAEAIEAAKQSRGTDVGNALKEIADLKNDKLPTIVVGDFNEPSHLDWTDAAAKAGRVPMKVEWPSTKAFADAGFTDSYRELNPDVIAHPGYTWTPTTKMDDPKDHHDRIDFILYRGTGIAPKTVEIIGEDKQHADIVVSPFPSDHRAVLTTFDLQKK